MQITVKFKYRSNRQTIDTKTSDSVLPRAVASAVTLATNPIESCASMSCNDEERDVILGVIPMNPFFDPSKPPAGETTHSSLTPLGDAAAGMSTASQLHRIPTEEVQVPASSRILLHTDPTSLAADRFRYLRMCLRELWNAGKLKSLLITSPLPKDGKSTIALNLATVLAEGGSRNVLLIEADLHHPTIVEQLGLEPRLGLAECLEHRLNPCSFVRRLEPLNWYLLAAGEAAGNPTELLQTDAFASVMQQLSPHFDWILIDSPPVSALTDALSLARQTNATLLVARKGYTPRKSIEKAIALLGKQRVLGIVLNAVEGLDRLYSGYYGYYGYRRSNRLIGAERKQKKEQRAIPSIHTHLRDL